MGCRENGWVRDLRGSAGIASPEGVYGDGEVRGGGADTVGDADGREYSFAAAEGEGN